VIVVAAVTACDKRSCKRQDPKDAGQKTTGEFGGPGSGFTAQCSGWFPDWISPNPPPAATAFQLSQGYPLGVPVLEETPDHKLKIARWDPFPPSHDVAESPWLAFDFHVAAQQPQYLDAIKEYMLDGMAEVDFDAGKNVKRSWYHVPMMTTDPNSRREPFHGMTKERALRSGDHKWIIDGTGGANNLDSFAVGYYNWLGGYTIGQVFGDPDPALADPAKGKFISGALVFKLLFAEYDTSKIDAAQDPLTTAPEWQVQDVVTPSAAPEKVRLLQVDIAVRDDRSAETGWVFATFVYDKSMTGETNAWRRLRPVGLMWGDDPDVTASGVGTVDETWLAPGIPSNLQRQDGLPYGRHGRLNGPVDNPTSSCISCHSTAQVVVGATPLGAFRGVDIFPPTACSDAQDMSWFRNIAAGTPFGVMTSAGDGCDLASPATATPPLHSVDYSLQLADALEASLFFHNPNPCAELASTLRDVDAPIALPGDGPARTKEMARLKELTQIDKLREIRKEGLKEMPLPVARKQTDATLVKIDAKQMSEIKARDDAHRR
jgi:hypothetical protein